MSYAKCGQDCGEAANEQIAAYEKAICDVYEYLKHHDVGAAMIRLRTTGALPT